MKKIGIVGGLGPEATIDYYKEIIQYFNQLEGNGSLNYPEIIIYSANLSVLIGYMNEKRYPEAVDYLSGCINKLSDAGADFIAISANTPHLLFNEIQARSTLPILSIVECVKQKSLELSSQNPGLIGTGFTMRSSFYSDSFKKAGLRIVAPLEKEMDIIHHKIFSELELGIFKKETKQIILDIVMEMKNRDKIDSLILGCTEFPLMFPEQEYAGLPFLNTTRIHVEAIVLECLRTSNR